MDNGFQKVWGIIRERISDRTLGFISGVILTSIISILSFYIILASLPAKVTALEEKVEDISDIMYTITEDNRLRDQKFDQLITTTNEIKTDLRDINNYLREAH